MQKISILLGSLTISIIAVVLTTLSPPAGPDERDGHFSLNSTQVTLSDPDGAVKRLAGTLRYRTVSVNSTDNHARDPEEFKGLHTYLRQQWPIVFDALEVQKVDFGGLDSSSGFKITPLLASPSSFG